MGSIKDQVAIIGMGCTKFGERWDKGTEDLAIEAAYEAFEDAGIDKNDIEACWLSTVMAPVIGVSGTIGADHLKLGNIPVIRNENWCASGHIALLEACMAVASGAYDMVMALGVEKLKDTGFPGLLRAVSRLPGLTRLRFTTSHPKDLSDELIHCFEELDNLCPHIHLPFQAGSNRVLKRMNRRYKREKYLELVEELRDTRPEIAITSDVMVGFPGETEEDFRLTLDLIKEVGFDNLYSFKYSDRKFTKAENMEGKIDETEKIDRLERLQTMQKLITLKNQVRLLSFACPILRARC